jgi:hypothetical protein
MILAAMPPASAAPQAAVVPRASLGPASAPAPVPVAATQLLRIAFPDTTNTLWGYGDLYGTASLGTTVAANTSPVVVGLPGAGFEIVFQDGNGHLAMAGTSSADGSVSAISARETGSLMAQGTSPAAVLIPGSAGSFQLAWQGVNGDVWVSGPTGGIDLGLPMAPDTSPAVIWLGTGYEVVYQTSDNHLALTGVDGTRVTGSTMAPGSSPAAVPIPGGGFQMAWRGDNGDLWVSGPTGGIDLAVFIQENTSPSIAWLPGSGYEVAVHDGLSATLWTRGAGFNGDTQQRMEPGTSPTIVATTNGTTGAPDYAITYVNADVVPQVQLLQEDAGSAGVINTGQTATLGASPGIGLSSLLSCWSAGAAFHRAGSGSARGVVLASCRW